VLHQAYAAREELLLRRACHAALNEQHVWPYAGEARDSHAQVLTLLRGGQACRHLLSDGLPAPDTS
jgi:hypothetical protein